MDRWVRVCVGRARGYRKSEMPEVIDRETVRALMQHGAQVVEVLDRHQPDGVHLRSAAGAPPRQLRPEPDDRGVVVYCFDHE